MTALAILEPVPAGSLSLPEIETARDFTLEALSASTRRAYRQGFRDFSECASARASTGSP